MIRYIVLVILPIFGCINCKYTPSERNKEVRALFKVISKYEKTRNIDSDIPISNQFGRFPFDTFWKALDYDEKTDDFVLAYDQEHMNYLETQYKKLRKDSINLWSETNIKIGKNLVDITPFNHYELFEKEWWDAYTKQYKYNAIRFYSYPLFNKEHTEAYIVFGCYHRNREKTLNQYTYVYAKNEKGEWEYSSNEGEDIRY